MAHSPDPLREDAARVSIRMGNGIAFDAGMTTVGLLAVGALVSSILLSSAVIVRARRRPEGVAAPLRLPAPKA